MNISHEMNGNVEAIVTVNVEPADYVGEVKSELKKIAKKNVIPGFRKGHVPEAQLRRLYGKNVKSDVINDIVYKAVYKYIDDNKFNVLGQPIPVEVKEITLEDTPYTFSYKLGLAPELDLEVNKDLALPYYKIAVSEEMMQEQDKHLRESLANQVPGDTVEGNALVKGTIMELNEDGTINEGEDAIQVVNGIVAPYYFKDKEQTELFMGKHVGDKVVFNPWATCNGNAAELSSMLNIDKEKTADMKSNFELAISEIIVAKPAEHNQDFYDEVFGKDKVHNEEEYNKALAKMIADSLVGNSNELFARDARKYFVDKYAGVELPEDVLKKFLVSQNEGLTEENIDAEFVNIRPDIVWEIVSGDIAKKLDVKVTEEMVNNYAKNVAMQQLQQYGLSAANLTDDMLGNYAKRILENADYRRHIIQDVEHNQLFGAIMNAVTLDEKTVSLDEFKALVNDAK